MKRASSALMIAAKTDRPAFRASGGAGLRRIEYMTAEACYWLALKRRVNLEQLDKARARKARRKETR